MDAISKKNSNDLIKQIASGNESAMHEMFNLYSETVYAFSLRRLNNANDAADVVNDVMLEVWKNAYRFEGRSKVKTWILGIANYKVIDIFRKRGKFDFSEVDVELEDETIQHAEVNIEQLQNKKNIEHCMDKLPDRHRQVVHLAFFEDMSYPEIAKILGCPTGTIKTRMLHARQKLKTCLQTLANMN